MNHITQILIYSFTHSLLPKSQSHPHHHLSLTPSTVMISLLPQPFPSVSSVDCCCRSNIIDHDAPEMMNRLRPNVALTGASVIGKREELGFGEDLGPGTSSAIYKISCPYLQFRIAGQFACKSWWWCGVGWDEKCLWSIFGWLWLRKWIICDK